VVRPGPHLLVCNGNSIRISQRLLPVRHHHSILSLSSDKLTHTIIRDGKITKYREIQF
jgi:hypothetical protein